ncbi:response regulator [Candidatus Leptofilum sp.]|uniref:response regulator n=1 Tax=Candidatus Leptofilum sp. TaxID=3241576 RepID=UPI003B5C4804
MSLKGKNIFLLEDDPINYSVILTILRQHGAIITHDHWGDTTLSRLKNHPFPLDLILLDLMLPGQASGYDVYDAIREMPELDGVPVVAVSAADPDVEIPKAREKGFHGFISKPINRRHFPDQLIEILAGETYWG